MARVGVIDMTSIFCIGRLAPLGRQRCAPAHLIAAQRSHGSVMVWCRGRPPILMRG